MADEVRKIPETIVQGRRLGRHVNHDPRSLAYQVIPTGAIASVEWKREIPILDQGNLGSCTGNAGTGALGTQPYHTEAAVAPLTLDETYAVQLYSDATKLDSDPQNYPPTDTGSDGLSVAKVLKARGLISGYLHATSLAAAKTAIQTGPVIIGSNWYDGFDNPDANGLVQITGSIRGGHEYEAVGYYAVADMWRLVNSWGTSYGIDGHFYYSSATLARLLAESGDVTSFVPASRPAPTPQPQPQPQPTPAPTPTPLTPFQIAALTLDPWAAKRHCGSNAAAAAAWKTYRKTQ